MSEEIQIYPWGHGKRYNDYSTYFKKKFDNRVQKIGIDAGFTCPNRDGTKGRGGCTYCNNHTFNPFYCNPLKTVTQQLNEGIAFFEPKYKSQQYLAYFQAYSNTYDSIDRLKKLWNEALSHSKVVGMVIGTRPDCISEEVLDYLSELSKSYYVVLELGIESTKDKTLETINRCHTYQDSVDAIKMSHERKIETGVHLILGLPGESRDEILMHATKISTLPITSLKLHHLQIIKGTEMARQYEKNPAFFELFSVEEYIEFMVEFLKVLNPGIILERFISEAPLELLIAPRWDGLKNFEIIHRIEKKLIETNSWQGMNYKV
jgi:radical SAM protein (TIGR01212 family)